MEDLNEDYSTLNQLDKDQQNTSKAMTFEDAQDHVLRQLFENNTGIINLFEAIQQKSQKLVRSLGDLEGDMGELEGHTKRRVQILEMHQTGFTSIETQQHNLQVMVKNYQNLAKELQKRNQSLQDD